MSGNGYVEEVLRTLRAKGMKVTPQRVAVIRYLEGNRNHPCAEEIHRAVTRTFPTISLATIYNTLETLEKVGAVRSVYVGTGRRHYDPETRPHDHVVCVRCRRIQDVFPEGRRLARIPRDLKDKFSDLSASVLFQGTCADCGSSSPS